MTGRDLLVLGKRSKWKIFPSPSGLSVRVPSVWNLLILECLRGDVHIFELQKNLLPIEDTDSSLEIEKAYKKYGIKMSLGVEKVSAKNNGKDVTITAVEGGKPVDYKFEMCLIAVGMTGNIENIGKTVGVKTDRGFIAVNDMLQTNVPNIYAIGDVQVRGLTPMPQVMGGCRS